MPLNFNRVTIAGNLTRDPQVKFLAGEKAVANFSLAINHRYKDDEGAKKEETTFIDIEAWGRTAELIGQYLTKGSNCFIEGRLKLESWEDKDTKAKRSKIKVVADNVQFLDRKTDTVDGTPNGTNDPSAAVAAPGAPAAAAPAASAPAAGRPQRQAPRPAAAGDDEPPF
jgi:single-strand DNA-binding protein